MVSPLGPTTISLPAQGTRARDILDRIAQALGRPANEFATGTTAGFDTGAADLLACWMALRTESARTRMLAAARAAVAAQAD